MGHDDDMMPRFLVSERGTVSPQPVGTDDVDDALVVGGFVNAHSHSFQRALRGRVEAGGRGDDDFWSWREAMYEDANAVTVDDVAGLAAWAFLDMVEAGFTAVGEFHYLHHVDGTDSRAASRAIADAARQVGIRLVLLQTAYARAGFAQSTPTARQQRFVRALGDLDVGDDRLTKAAVIIGYTEALQALSRLDGAARVDALTTARRFVRDFDPGLVDPDLAEMDGVLSALLRANGGQ